MSAWSGRLIQTPGGLHPSINLGKDGHRTKVFDVNGDGLVDIVRTTGTELQIWFALGRYPGGDGLFGHAWWTGAKTAQISLDPVTRPLPWSALPISFEEQEIRIADMNGDGLSDIIRLRKGDIRYWPGRGDGTFGTGPLGKQGPAYSQDTYAKMTTSPWYTQRAR